ncbi:MAG: DUF1318 domain-containing protein [Thermodesulfatator sp.]|nr:MAG: DUF1318 domain-containing protein [Thermodesulfatator sp.]
MKILNLKSTIVLLVFLITACVTVNIYFPAAEVRQAAEDIATDIRGQQPDQNSNEKSMDSSPTSWLQLGSLAYAGRELTVSNATIRQLKDRMKKRYPALMPYLKKGNVGEGANGLLVIKSQAGLGLKQKADLKRLVNAENSDRMALYKAVAQSLNIPGSQISRVQKIFAQEWQKTAPRGTFVERSPGNWVRK